VTYPLPRSNRAPGALDVIVVIHPMAVDPSKSPTQLGESGTLYGSATTTTSLSRMIWKSRSGARLDLPRLSWSMRLILLSQLHNLPPAICRCCCCCWCYFFGGDGGGKASLCSFRGGWFAEGCFFPGQPSCLWRRACRPSHPMVGGCPERFAQGASACGGGTFSCTVSASAPVAQVLSFRSGHDVARTCPSSRHL
jgi:hypothetical protein